MSIGILLEEVEGFALVQLCHSNPITRRLALILLREVRSLGNCLGEEREALADIIERDSPAIIVDLLANNANSR